MLCLHCAQQLVAALRSIPKADWHPKERCTMLVFCTFLSLPNCHWLIFPSLVSLLRIQWADCPGCCTHLKSFFGYMHPCFVCFYWSHNYGVVYYRLWFFPVASLAEAETCLSSVKELAVTVSSPQSSTSFSTSNSLDYTTALKSTTTMAFNLSITVVLHRIKTVLSTVCCRSSCLCCHQVEGLEPLVRRGVEATATVPDLEGPSFCFFFI